jgi:ABC-type transport system involved in Fe-S cluster assembly fused permease/ATPase subunit
LDVIGFGIAYMAMFSFDLNKLNQVDLFNYNIEISLYDVFILCVLRSLFVMAGFFKFSIFYWSFWWVFNAIVLLICKGIVFEWNADTFRTLLLVMSLLLCLAEFVVVFRIRSHALTPNESPVETQREIKTEALSKLQLLRVLKPYFWPDGLVNRIRVGITWLMLITSKATSIMAPLYIGYAVTQITDNGEIPYRNIVMYCGLGLVSNIAKELQNIVYIKVKQTAFSQLSQFTFAHLHSLSLEWHLSKKMGDVIRSMDRGVQSADSVVSYLFLYMLPTLVECFVIFVIFFAHFKQPWLTVIAFASLTYYILWTVQLTIWRQQFRENMNKHDNTFHDRAIDSLVNYETVKYFANEDFEIDRYCEAVNAYQADGVTTQVLIAYHPAAISLSFPAQVSLSALNITQKAVITACQVGDNSSPFPTSFFGQVGCLLVAAWEIVRRDTMDLGDFVSVNVYLMNLFMPLSFLGSLYSMIMQAITDMQNLSELLAVQPHVFDVLDAKALAPTRPGQVRLEFRDVWFHYPSMPADTGLKGVSFSVAPGTTTGIVGHTGAGTGNDIIFTVFCCVCVFA